MAAVQASRRSTLTEEACVTIKGRSLFLQLPPCMAFTEAQLAEDLHLSTMPVREYLGWVQREGPVDLGVRWHYYVAPITLKDVRDLFSVRMLLEGTEASLAACQAADLADLRELEDLSQLGYDPQDDTSISQVLAREHAVQGGDRPARRERSVGSDLRTGARPAGAYRPFGPGADYARR